MEVSGLVVADLSGHWGLRRVAVPTPSPRRPASACKSAGVPSCVFIEDRQVKHGVVYWGEVILTAIVLWLS